MIFKDTFFVVGTRTIHLDQFPLPSAYYQQQFPGLKAETEKVWVSVKCCFHKDRQPSLRLNLKHGGFRCFSCGTRGGSIIAFHCQRYQLSFMQTILALGG